MTKFLWRSQTELQNIVQGEWELMIEISRVSTFWVSFGQSWTLASLKNLPGISFHSQDYDRVPSEMPVRMLGHANAERIPCTDKPLKFLAGMLYSVCLVYLESAIVQLSTTNVRYKLLVRTSDVMNMLKSNNHVPHALNGTNEAKKSDGILTECGRFHCL